MAPTSQALQPLRCWRNLLKPSSLHKPQVRFVSAATLRYRNPPPPLPRPEELPPGMTYSEYKNLPKLPHTIKVHSPPPSARTVCREPIRTFDAQQTTLLDPTGSRTRFLAKTNPDAARVGDVVLVRFRSGDPFAGVLLSIRQRGVDTAVLLRNHLARVGTEMWVKIYSPNVSGMELVQRKEKRARRARLYYMRKPKHDRGSLEGIVEAYVKQKKATGRGLVGGARAKSKEKGGKMPVAKKGLA